MAALVNQITIIAGMLQQCIKRVVCGQRRQQVLKFLLDHYHSFGTY